jgi:hypothetical protein
VANTWGVRRAGWGDRPGDDALPFAIALHHRAEPFHYTNRLVADGQARADGILALKDMHIRPADRRRGDLEGDTLPYVTLRPAGEKLPSQ